MSGYEEGTVDSVLEVNFVQVESCEHCGHTIRDEDEISITSDGYTLHKKCADQIWEG